MGKIRGIHRYPENCILPSFDHLTTTPDLLWLQKGGGRRRTRKVIAPMIDPITCHTAFFLPTAAVATLLHSLPAHLVCWNRGREARCAFIIWVGLPTYLLVLQSGHRACAGECGTRRQTRPL